MKVWEIVLFVLCRSHHFEELQIHPSICSNYSAYKNTGYFDSLHLSGTNGRKGSIDNCEESVKRLAKIDIWLKEKTERPLMN